MNIKSPVDLETGLVNGRELLTEKVDALGETLEQLDLKSRAETGAADLLDAARSKDGRLKSAVLAIGGLLLVVALVLRRMNR